MEYKRIDTEHHHISGLFSDAQTLTHSLTMSIFAHRPIGVWWSLIRNGARPT